MEYEEFKEHYEKFGRCPNDWKKREKPLNEKQLQTRFRLYKLYQAGPVQEVDEDWEFLKKEVDLRDKHRCRLISILPPDQLRILKKNAGPMISILDHAHVLSRSSRPDLKYTTENVILLNRYSHSMIDQGRDPVTGILITKETAELWWRLIIGDDLYDQLISSKKKTVRRTHV